MQVLITQMTFFLLDYKKAFSESISRILKLNRKNTCATEKLHIFATNQLLIQKR